MPIYPYKCSACGHADDVLQKMSDAALTVCPACGKSTYAKQLTAPGFALKGSGWYATDFKGGGTAKPAVETATAKEGAGSEAKSETKTDAKAEAKTESKVEAKATPVTPASGG